ncbi:MAG: glycosyltransferase [Pirellulales bacterium]
MNVLLFPVGSYGDVHPYVGLGLELQKRGHQVSVITSQFYTDLMNQVGLHLVPIDTLDEHEIILNDPLLFHPTRGFATVAKHIILPWQMRQYELIQRLMTDDTVIVGPCMAMGLPLAHEKLGVPWVTIHLQPSVFWSNLDPPQLKAGIPTGPGYPQFWNAAFYWLANKIILDPVLKKTTNANRANLGLPPVKRASTLWHAPQRSLGFFPDWFAPLQPDWPPQTQLTGFPMWDESSIEPLDDGVLKFLEQGDPPIAFTPGSGMVNANQFFAEAAKACTQMGRRGILLTRFPEQIPDNLPESVRHFSFVPLSQLLPHCAALVYHGGIGTLSQACQASVPHLIMPMSFDQPDNAARIKRLGIGDWLMPKKFKAANIAKKLTALIDNPAVKKNCEVVAEKMQGNKCLPQAADAIEAVVE